MPGFEDAENAKVLDRPLTGSEKPVEILQRLMQMQELRAMVYNEFHRSAMIV